MLKKIFLGAFLLVPFIVSADQTPRIDPSSSSSKEQSNPTAASVKWLDPRVVQPGYTQILPIREKALKRAIRRMKREEAQVGLKNERTRIPHGRVQIHHEDRKIQSRRHEYRRIQNNHKRYRKSQLYRHERRRLRDTHMKDERAQIISKKVSPVERLSPCSEKLNGSSPACIVEYRKDPR